MQEDAGTMLDRVSALRASLAAGALQHGGSAEIKLVVKDFGYTKLESDLLYCLSSGFKAMEICTDMLLASAERALQYGCSLSVEPSILQQQARLQAVRNSQLC